MPFSRRLYARRRVSRLADKPTEPIASIEEPGPFNERPIFAGEQGDFDPEITLDDEAFNVSFPVLHQHASHMNPILTRPSLGP